MEDPEDPKIIEYKKEESADVKWSMKRIPFKHYDGHNA